MYNCGVRTVVILTSLFLHKHSIGADKDDNRKNSCERGRP